jgi:hypothetical protein
MTESAWFPIAVVWLVTLVLGGVLWRRFTRVPVQTGGFTSRTTAPAMRRVVPLWLVVVLVILLVAAAWLTVQWGAPLWRGVT